VSDALLAPTIMVPSNTQPRPQALVSNRLAHVWGATPAHGPAWDVYQGPEASVRCRCGRQAGSVTSHIPQAAQSPMRALSINPGW